MLSVMPCGARGPLAGVVMERLAAWLSSEGYVAGMVPQVLGVARALSAWMDDRSVALPALTVQTLDAFRGEYGLGVPGHAIVQERIPTVRRFLVEAGYVHGEVPASRRSRRPVAQPAPPISQAAAGELDAWALWQRQARGISEACIQHRRGWVAALVNSLPVIGEVIDWSACDVTFVNVFITQRSEGSALASRTALVDATRSLLRWALAAGRINHDLTGGILRARATRATLAKGLSVEQVRALLAACDPDTMAGVRDTAVITMLWRLGLRAGEAAGLSLDDVDWAVGRVSIIGKGPRRLTLPIPVDVGHALVAWLRVRPECLDRAMFVRVRPPTRALSSAGISDIVKHRAEAAGLEGSGLLT